MRRRLTQAGYRATLIDTAIERLTSIGLLDDESFATAWVESRDRAHPRGERALRSELRRKGLADDIVAGALERRRDVTGETGTDVDEAAARALLVRHARALDRIEDPRLRRQRAYGLLARNGFDPDIAARIAREDRPETA